MTPATIQLSVIISIAILAVPFEFILAQDEGASTGILLPPTPEVKLLDGRTTRGPEHVGTQLMISVTHTSNREQETPYMLLIEIRGSDGTTRFIGWQTGVIAPSERRDVSMLWTPGKVEDIYNIRSFVISGFEEPVEIFSTIGETTFETYKGDYF